MGVKEKLAKELEALEVAAGIKPKPTESGNDPGTKEPAVATEPDLNAVATPETGEMTQEPPVRPAPQELQPTVQAEPTERQKRTNWKLRFTNLKSHHDAKMAEVNNVMAQQFDNIANLQKQVGGLQDELAKLRKAEPFSAKDIATKEELDVIGEQGISAIDKLTNRAVEKSTAHIEEELKRIREIRESEARRLASQHRDSAVNSFQARLGELVPNFKTIDVDPGFVPWLRQPDTTSGVERMTLLKNAESTGDVGRVAEFFLEYQGKTLTGQQKLEQKVTPVGANGSPQVQVNNDNNGNVEIMSMTTIDAFTNDVIKGRYRGREDERKAMVAKIDLAYAEGRIGP